MLKHYKLEISNSEMQVQQKINKYKDKEKAQQYEKLLQEAIKAKHEAEKAGSEAEIAEMEKYIMENVHKKAAELGIDTRTGIQGAIVQAIMKGGRALETMLEAFSQFNVGWSNPALPMLNALRL